MNDRIVLTDDLLRRALMQRMAHAPSEQLLERIMAGADGTAQDRAPRSWGPLGRRTGSTPRVDSRRRWMALPALGGVAAVVVAAAVIALAVRPIIPGPGATPTPTPTSAPLPPTDPLLRPVPVRLGEFDALRLRLDLADPIDIAFADGSVWTANIHGDDVRRFDTETMEQVAVIDLPAGSGPAWFTVAESDIWVTHQLGSGISRIDPETNAVIGRVGQGPTCAAPVQAFGSIWQSVCDGGTFLRIDPSTSTVLETFPAEGHGFLAVVEDRLITVASPDAPTPNALTELDPEAGSFTPLPFSVEGFSALLGSDGETLWVMTFTGVKRIDSTDGRVIATFPYTDAQAVSFIDGRAWMTVTTRGVLEIDLTTNQILRQVPVPAGLTVARELDGVLWVSDFGNSYLWRIEL